jgi:hypothetical protein
MMEISQISIPPTDGNPVGEEFSVCTRPPLRLRRNYRFLEQTCLILSDLACTYNVSETTMIEFLAANWMIRHPKHE